MLRKVLVGSGSILAAVWALAAAGVLWTLGGSYLSVVRRLADAQPRYAFLLLAAPLLPMLLVGLLLLVLRRGMWIPYVVSAAVAVLLPLLFVPRWPHVVPWWGWLGLALAGVSGLVSIYAAVAIAQADTNGAATSEMN